MKIAIVGAGIAGIATAIRLAAKGHQITVFEANDYPGGKLSAFDQEGYRFDAGPSLFTMPQYVEELFRVAGEEPGAHFAYQRMETACCYWWPDNTRLRAWGDSARFAAEVESQLGVPAGKIVQYLKTSATKYRLAGYIFLEKSLHRLRTWLSGSVAASLLRLPSFDIFTSMHCVNQQAFDDRRLVQLFDRVPLFPQTRPKRLDHEATRKEVGRGAGDLGTHWAERAPSGARSPERCRDLRVAPARE
jgi:phytoene dehydrogenase-like protein